MICCQASNLVSDAYFTVNQVLVRIDTEDTRTRALVNDTLAYVALSRPRRDAQIFTDDADQLGKALSRHQQNPTALAQENLSTSYEPVLEQPKVRIH